MIIYSLKTNDLLRIITNLVSRNENRYWFHGSIPIHKVNSVLPKLINNYDLDISQSDRSNLARKGHPTWSMVVHFDYKQIGFIQFWLFTTGYRPSDRMAQFDKNRIDSLNKELVLKQNLKSIYTSNPNELLSFKEYVLGQYIHHKDLSGSMSYKYLHPQKYGLQITPEIIESIQSGDHDFTINSLNKNFEVKISHTLKNEEDSKYQGLKENFGFIFLKEHENNRDNKVRKAKKAKEMLVEKFGIKVPDDTPNNTIISLLYNNLRKANNRYIHEFQRHSQKNMVFTWYLSKGFISNFEYEIEKKIKRIPTSPQQFEEAMGRLFSHGNYRGVRHQIGQLNALIRAKVNHMYPILYQRLNLPNVLHFMGSYTSNQFSSFREFQDACVKQCIEIQQQNEINKNNKLRYRKIRKKIRTSSDDFMNESTYKLNKLIRENDTKEPEKIHFSKKDYEEFIEKNPEMNPKLISKLI